MPLDGVADPALVPAAVASTIGVRGEPGKSPTRSQNDSRNGRCCSSSTASTCYRRRRAFAAPRTLCAIAGGGDEPSGPPCCGRARVPVSPLGDDDAFALFSERARAVRPDFQPATDEDVVREICARVDGLPLAVELAAARLKVLRHASWRRARSTMSVLTAGGRDRPSRQQTMRAAIEWSYSLLDQDEGDLFARLAVFAGGWSLAAAEALPEQPSICSARSSTRASLSTLEELAGEPRYSMLETIHEFAAEKLRKRPDPRGPSEPACRVLRRSDARSTDAEVRRNGSSDPAFLRLEADTENIRSALGWAAETGSELELRLATLYQLSPRVRPC